MSVYSVKDKGWRYDFTLEGQRYTKGWFETKREARQAEAKRREEILRPPETTPAPETPTDITFLELVNLRLDHVQAYHSKIYYAEYVYKARKWVKLWGELKCGQISQNMVEGFLMKRKKVSAQTANKEIRYLKATFNFGKKKKLILANPVEGIDFFPVDKTLKYLPSVDDIDKVIAVADHDTQDYLWTIRETMGRVNEINRLVWDDVLFDERCVVLYTRKKRGGHRTPRKVPMTERLFSILKRRFDQRQPSVCWVFWHTYWSSKTGRKEIGPFQDRKRIMKTLCQKAGVKYFRFHALRHSGASILERGRVPIGSIQRILGHENRTTTEIYLHSIAESEREAMLVLEKAHGNSHTDSHTETKKD